MFWRRKKEETVDAAAAEPAVPDTARGRELSVLHEEPVAAPTPAPAPTAVEAEPESATTADAPEETGSTPDSELLCETDGARDAVQQAAEDAPDVSEEQVVAALSTVYDPEIPVNIYELGLIYGVVLKPGDDGPTDVDIKMTLTSPHCPVAETLPGDVAAAARTVPGVGEVDVEVVWDPTWNPDMMSEAAKLELGMF